MRVTSKGQVTIPKSVREALGKEDAVEAFTNAVALPPAVDGSEGRGADDGVQAWGVAASGADGDSFDGTHSPQVYVRLGSKARLSSRTLCASRSERRAISWTFRGL